MDYRRLAIDELRHIKQVRASAEVCRDRLLELNGELTGIKIPVPKADPVIGGGNKTEERWLNIIAAKGDEETRLRSVMRRIKRFDSAWDALSDRDKRVLSEWYITGGAGAAERVATKEFCDIRTAYRWRDDAIIQFTRAYFGAVVN